MSRIFSSFFDAIQKFLGQGIIINEDNLDELKLNPEKLVKSVEADLLRQSDDAIFDDALELLNDDDDDNLSAYTDFTDTESVFSSSASSASGGLSVASSYASSVASSVASSTLSQKKEYQNKLRKKLLIFLFLLFLRCVIKDNNLMMMKIL